MAPHEKRAFLDLLTDALSFYGKDVSKFALSVWWEACQGYDFEQVSKALTAHAMDAERGQFAPKPADIVRALQGTRTDRALTAWGKLMDAMQRVGAYQSVVFDDPIIHAVVEDMGGWMKLCRSNMDELSYTEHRFCEAYRAYAARPADLVYPAKLIGQYEIDNNTASRKTAPPVLIGKPDKAKQVLERGASGAKTQITMASDYVPAIKRLEAQA